MRLNRREALLSTAAAAGALVLRTSESWAERGRSNALPILPLIDARERGNGIALEAVATPGVLRLEPDRSPGPSAKTIPTQLAGAAGADASKATRRRVLTLTMGHGMMGRAGMGRGMMGGPSRPGMAGLPAQMFGIDGRSFELDRVDHTVRLGDTEIWEVSGEMMPHPFHIHGAYFTVLSRDGRAPAATDQGLKDTVLVQERVELPIRFTQPAVRVPFVFHCHTLEHEDAGMMGQYRTA